jgi:quinol monooxygenase YgiN
MQSRNWIVAPFSFGGGVADPIEGPVERRTEGCLFDSWVATSREEEEMYGTIARMRIKPGMEDRFEQYLSKFDNRDVPGAMGYYVYRMDKDPNELYLAVIFDSRESYRANAESPDQDAEYREMLEMLVEEPEWHDGEIIRSEVISRAGFEGRGR